MACPRSAWQPLLILLGVVLQTVTSTVSQPLFVGRPLLTSRLPFRPVGKELPSVSAERSTRRRLDEEQPPENASSGNGTAETALPFDCQAALSNFLAEWSEQKMRWCCEHEQKGCQTDSAPTSKPFDCEASLDNFATEWSSAKMEWCCQNEQKGCQAPSSPAAASETQNEGAAAIENVTGASPSAHQPEFDCQVSLNDWQVAWGDVKKEWCCRHESLGCESSTSPAPPPAAAEQEPEAPAAAQQPGEEECEGSPDSWSEERRNFCCQTKRLGCPEGAANPAAAQTQDQGTPESGQGSAAAEPSQAGEQQGSKEEPGASESGQGNAAAEPSQAGEQQGSKEEQGASESGQANAAAEPGQAGEQQGSKEEQGAPESGQAAAAEPGQAGEQQGSKEDNAAAEQGQGGEQQGEKEEERAQRTAEHQAKEEGEDAREGGERAEQRERGEGGEEHAPGGRPGPEDEMLARTRTARAQPTLAEPPAGGSSSGPGIYLVGLLSLGIPMVVYVFHCRGGKDMRRRTQSWGGIGASTIGRSSGTYTQMRTMSSTGSYVPPSF